MPLPIQKKRYKASNQMQKAYLSLSDIRMPGMSGIKLAGKYKMNLNVKVAHDFFLRWERKSFLKCFLQRKLTALLKNQFVLKI